MSDHNPIAKRAEPIDDLTEIESKDSSGVRLPSPLMRRVIDKMVFDGLARTEAAEACGVGTKSVYWALRKPHVARYYNEALHVLRTSGRARRFHRLEAIAEQDRNLQAAVNAIRVAEELTDTGLVRGGHHRPTAPGLVIQIIGVPQVKIAEPKSKTLDGPSEDELRYRGHKDAPLLDFWE